MCGVGGGALTAGLIPSMLLLMLIIDTSQQYPVHTLALFEAIIGGEYKLDIMHITHT